MCIHVYIFVYKHRFVYRCTFVFFCWGVNVCIYTCIHMYVCLYIYVHKYIHINILHIYTYIHICIYICIYMYVPIYMYIYMCIFPDSLYLDSKITAWTVFTRKTLLHTHSKKISTMQQTVAHCIKLQHTLQRIYSTHILLLQRKHCWQKNHCNALQRTAQHTCNAHCNTYTGLTSPGYNEDTVDKKIIFRYCFHTGFVPATPFRRTISELDVLPRFPLFHFFIFCFLLLLYPQHTWRSPEVCACVYIFFPDTIVETCV